MAPVCRKRKKDKILISSAGGGARMVTSGGQKATKDRKDSAMTIAKSD